jgi:hypothetical protein
MKIGKYPYVVTYVNHNEPCNVTQIIAIAAMAHDKNIIVEDVDE